MSFTPEKKIFTYKFVRVLELGECSQDIINMINPQNKQQVFDILEDKKLTDKTFVYFLFNPAKHK